MDLYTADSGKGNRSLLFMLAGTVAVSMLQFGKPTLKIGRTLDSMLPKVNRLRRSAPRSLLMKLLVFSKWPKRDPLA